MQDNERWQAFETRDAAFDGIFVVAVRSTGIFCRPTCPARRPRRENVVFFDTTAQAEQAGFRACRRCRPTEPHPDTASAEWVGQAARLIEARVGERMTLEELSYKVGVSPHHLQRTFKQIMGVSPRQYAEALRVRRVKSTLRQEETVTMAMYEAGYGSSSRLYATAGDRLGMTPRTYKKGGAGMSIAYTLADSPLGRVMVAATPRGVCFVSLGDDDATLEGELRHDYPAASIQRDDSALTDWVAAVLHYLRGEEPRLDLPLDIQGTAFQWRVWEALRAIPYGETRTYSEIAALLDNPHGQRAVGRACATNPVSLVIPCHRAMREDGHLGGYRWGLDRKESLLAHERRELTTEG